MNEENKKISYEDFSKVEIKVGQILSAEKIPDTDKLLKLMVDFGDTPSQSPPLPPKDGSASGGKEGGEGRDIRQIVSGIALYFSDTQTLVGKKCLFVTNLEPRVIKGHESNGMILALSTGEGAFSLLEPNESIKVGTRVK